jgi:hypothetical protein
LTTTLEIPAASLALPVTPTEPLVVHMPLGGPVIETVGVPHGMVVVVVVVDVVVVVVGVVVVVVDVVVVVEDVSSRC